MDIDPLLPPVQATQKKCNRCPTRIPVDGPKGCQECREKGKRQKANNRVALVGRKNESERESARGMMAQGRSSIGENSVGGGVKRKRSPQDSQTHPRPAPGVLGDITNTVMNRGNAPIPDHGTQDEEAFWNEEEMLDEADYEVSTSLERESTVLTNL
jgi:hypothetical protein